MQGRAEDSRPDGQRLNNQRPDYQENILVTTLMFPLRATSQAYDFLSGVWGFKAIIAPVAACYALGLGVESIYLSIPSALELTGYKTELASEEAKQELRFMPKIGIDDGAKFSRLLPLRQTSNLVASQGWVPGWIASRVVTQERNVWDNPGLFLFAFLVSASIQYYERQITAPQKLQDKRSRFIESNNQKIVKASEDAIPIARLRAAQVNAHGTGEVTTNALCVLLVYSLEFSAFFSSFKSSATSWPVLWLYCLFTIFGFELFMGHGEGKGKEVRPGGK